MSTNEEAFLEKVRGKRIQNASFSYDGGAITDLTLDFDDASAFSFSFIHQPVCHGRYYPDRESDGEDVVVTRRGN